MDKAKMRSIYDIQRDIARVSNLLNILILEKKLTVSALEGLEVSSKIMAEKVIEKMKQ
jgi:hypothetical protein